MTKDYEKDRLLIRALNRHLYFAEIGEALASVTYNMMVDEMDTEKRVIPKLIKIMELLELEHRSIMKELVELNEQFH